MWLCYLHLFRQAECALLAARCANVKPPSAITCAAVVAQMEAIEAEQREETRRLDAEQNEDGGTRCPPRE